MTKPPQLLSEKERLQRRKQIADLRKQKEELQHRILAFQDTLYFRVKEFLHDEKQDSLKLDHMSKPQRALAYSVLEKFNIKLVCQSFGKEEVDRHMVIFKPNSVPCDAEIFAMKRGDVYNPETDNVAQDVVEEAVNAVTSRKSSKKEIPEYLQKYEKHFGGLEVAKDAARSTKTTRTYGFVSSDLKSDKRTIEETLADIQARKKQKVCQTDGST